MGRRHRAAVAIKGERAALAVGERRRKPPAQWLMVARVTAPRLSEIEGAGVPTTRSAIDIGREAVS
ncbi:MAG TPA: hypothetical protein VEH76_05380 [Methylocystis sp.]|nr:hypothetical protein [Methylocystis sp.]